MGVEFWVIEKFCNFCDGMKMFSFIYVVVIEKYFFLFFVFVGVNIWKGVFYMSINDIDIDV